MCGKTFCGLDYLKRHVVQEYGGVVKQQGRLQEQLVSSASKSSLLAATCQPTLGWSTQQSGIRLCPHCNACGKTFRSPNDLKRHIQMRKYRAAISVNTPTLLAITCQPIGR